MPSLDLRLQHRVLILSKLSKLRFLWLWYDTHRGPSILYMGVYLSTWHYSHHVTWCSVFKGWVQKIELFFFVLWKLGELRGQLFENCLIIKNGGKISIIFLGTKIFETFFCWISVTDIRHWNSLQTKKNFRHPDLALFFVEFRLSLR